MTIQWFPGHMAKTKRLLEENKAKVDVFIEVLDARLPHSSHNPLLEEMLGDKLRLKVLNKADLADPGLTEYWLKAYGEQKRVEALATCAKEPGSRGKIIQAVMSLARDYGVSGRVRAMVVGIPNCGKSTLINLLSKGKKAPVGAKPGFTRSLQRIKVSDEFELLDTPGILWHKFEDQSVGIKLALLAAIKEDILDRWALCQYILRFAAEYLQAGFQQRFGLDPQGEFLPLMEDLARRRGMIKKGGVADYERVASMLIKEFQEGKLGTFTLDNPRHGALWGPLEDQGEL
jgi:ribosome biogenesis GTPase A